jgi:hypothetical protein
MQLTPEGDGTRLTTTFDYALPGGVFGTIADALIVAHECQESRRSSPQLQSARRTAVGCYVTGEAGFEPATFSRVEERSRRGAR